MAAPVSLADENYRLREKWNKNEGVPIYLTKDSGAGWKACKRMIRRDLSGRTDYRTPTTTSLPGAGATSVSTAVDVSSGIAGNLFQITTYHEWNQHAEWDWRILQQGYMGDGVYPTNGNPIDRQMTAHVQRAENIASIYLYQAGGGAIAHLDPAQTIAINDTTVKLTLPRTAIRFESQTTDTDTGLKAGGDTIVFAVDDGEVAAPAGVKNFETKLDGVRREAGILVLETPIPEDPLNPGVSIVRPGDFVFFKGSYTNVFRGIAAWNPIDGSTANLDILFNGVKRSQNPEKLAGLRIPIGAGEDPWPKYTRISEKLFVNSSKVDFWVTTPEEMTLISNAVRDGTMPGQWAMRKGMYSESKTGMTYSYSVPVLRVRDPKTQRDIDIAVDEYLAVIDKGPESQTLYRGWDSSQFAFHTTVRGSWQWANFDGNGPLYQRASSSIVEATWTVRAEYNHDAPLNSFIASPDVTNE